MTKTVFEPAILAKSGKAGGTPGDTQEAPRGHPGGTQEAPRRSLGGIWGDLGLQANLPQKDDRRPQPFPPF